MTTYYTGKYLEENRRLYHSRLLGRERKQKARDAFLRPIESPLFQAKWVHPEEEADKVFINEHFEAAGFDLNAVDQELQEISKGYEKLLEDFRTFQSELLRDINNERERLHYLNLLTHHYKGGTNNVIPIIPREGEGVFHLTEGYVHAPINEINEVGYEILDLSGNGQAGNAYIYKDASTPYKDIYDASNQSILQERRSRESFEYQKLNATPGTPAYSPLSFDTRPARMTLTLRAHQSVNQLSLRGTRSFEILQIEISNNGKDYRPLLNMPIPANEGREPTTAFFDSGAYLRITLESKKTQRPLIGITEGDETTTFLETIERSVIELQDLILFQNTYRKTGQFEYTFSLDEPANIVALYAEEWTDYAKEKSEGIKYQLFINGEAYPIVPINALRNGNKILQYLPAKVENISFASVKHLKESIKSLRLRIDFSATSFKHIPTVKNLKLILGKEKER